MLYKSYITLCILFTYDDDYYYNNKIIIIIIIIINKNNNNNNYYYNNDNYYYYYKNSIQNTTILGDPCVWAGKLVSAFWTCIMKRLLQIM
jgi:hypothetical protein